MAATSLMPKRLAETATSPVDPSLRPLSHLPLQDLTPKTCFFRLFLGSSPPCSHVSPNANISLAHRFGFTLNPWPGLSGGRGEAWASW